MKILVFLLVFLIVLRIWLGVGEVNIVLYIVVDNIFLFMKLVCEGLCLFFLLEMRVIFFDFFLLWVMILKFFMWCIKLLWIYVNLFSILVIILVGWLRIFFIWKFFLCLIFFYYKICKFFLEWIDFFVCLFC